LLGGQRSRCTFHPSEELLPHLITPHSASTWDDASNSNSELPCGWGEPFNPGQDACAVSSAVIGQQVGEGLGDPAGWDGSSSSDYFQEGSAQLLQPISEPTDADYDLTSHTAALNFCGFGDLSLSSEFEFPISLPLSPFSPCSVEVPRNPTLSSTPSPYSVLDHTVQRDIGTSVAFMGNRLVQIC
jgi:hypothetical protein